MTPEDFKEEWSIQDFKNHLWERIGQNNNVYPNWMLKEFCDHWGEKPGGRNKMRWQLKGWNKSGIFMISGRLASWKTNSMEWHPKRWKAKDAPMKPTKWRPVNDSPEALEEVKEINKGYDRLKKIAESQPKRGAISMMAQDLINKSRPVPKKELKDIEQDELDYQEYKRNLLGK